MSLHDVLDIGALLNALGSPLSALLGSGVAVIAGLQAATDWATGKVRFRPLRTTGDAARDARRRGLRRRIVALWLIQLVIAISSIYFAIQLYFVSPIPKEEPPDLHQSWLLIDLTGLTVLAILIALVRARTTFRSDQLKE